MLEQLGGEGILARDSAFASRSAELLPTPRHDDVSAATVADRAGAAVVPPRVALTGFPCGGVLTLPTVIDSGRAAPLRERLLDRAGRILVPVLVLRAENDRPMPIVAPASGRW